MALRQRERKIGERLKLARELTKFSQAEVARQLHISRERLLTYESLRAPLRCELALRFCRQFVISEEWLATGKPEAWMRASMAHSIAPGMKEGWAGAEQLYMRQCVDLHSEEIARSIPHGMLFGDAYEKHLATEYSALVRQYFYHPRVVLTDFAEPDLLRNWWSAFLDRTLLLIQNEAKRFRQDDWFAQRNFIREIFRLNHAMFGKYAEMNFDPGAFQSFGRSITEAITRSVVKRSEKKKTA